MGLSQFLMDLSYLHTCYYEAQVAFWSFDFQVKKLLHSVNGNAYPGRLLAIMGPSGSGKTTLLNTLASQLPRNKRIRLTGELLSDGTPRNQTHTRYNET